MLEEFQSGDASGNGLPEIVNKFETLTVGDVGKSYQDPFYTTYLDPAFPLIQRVQAAFTEVKLAPAHQKDALDLLAPLKVKHLPTYEHSLRVALVARDIASFLQMDARALLLAGLLHDLGKSQVPLELLNKTRGWTAEDAKIMRRHVMDGYRQVRDRFDFSAELILWSHRFQENGYPEKLPKLLHDYSEGTKAIIPQYGRILAMSDVYDSLHRKNDRHGDRAGLSGEEIREKMLAYNPDKEPLVEALFRAGVLTTFILGEVHQQTAELDADDELYNESFRYTDSSRTPENTRRHIAVATALEALSDKNGCTTRYQDISRHLKLEYFVTAGINISDAFSYLAEQIELRLPKVNKFYHAAYRAQLNSKRNRRGGRVNQGIIELLVPIVAAQHIYDPQYDLNCSDVLRQAFELLQFTDREDVDQLVKMKKLAFALSKYDRLVPEHSEAKNVMEYYERDLLVSETPTSIAHNGEFLGGFPTVLDVCKTLEHCPYPHFNQRVQEAFHHVRGAHNPEVASGFLADCIAAGIYLTLSQNPRKRIIG